MPGSRKGHGFLNLRSGTQLLAALLFIGLGIYILLNTFENNYILHGIRKQLFGAILCAYGIVRVTRVYLTWRAQKPDDYENPD